MIRQKSQSKALDRMFPLKPIRSEADHEAATMTLRQLVGSKPEAEFSPDERDYLEVLTMLVHDYQQRRRCEQLRALNPAEILHHLMEENALSVTDLGNVIGSRTAASMILNGRRTPSKVHILRLSERFGVDPSLFLAETPRHSKNAKRSGKRMERSTSSQVGR